MKRVDPQLSLYPGGDPAGSFDPQHPNVAL